MSMNDVTKAVWRELQTVTGRKDLRLKDVLEWSTSEKQVKDNLRDGEVAVFCPELGAWAAIPAPKESTTSDSAA